jgi:hypothetical protein
MACEFCGPEPTEPCAQCGFRPADPTPEFYYPGFVLVDPRQRSWDARQEDWKHPGLEDKRR